MEPLDAPAHLDTPIDPAAIELPVTVAVTIDISQLLRAQASSHVVLDLGTFESARVLTENPNIEPMLGLVSRSIEAALGFLELTHIRVLVVLSQKDAMSVAELAALMKARSRSMAKILDAMEDAGWIVTASPVAERQNRSRSAREDVTWSMRSPLTVSARSTRYSTGCPRPWPERSTLLLPPPVKHPR
jgi:hypothetical protein